MNANVVENVNPVAVDPDLQSLVELMASGKKDPALLHRIRKAAEAARRDILEKQGVRNIAVELVHQARDGE